jgi:hypothetical protein
MDKITKQKDDAKFRELILYFAMLSQDDPAFGVTKLNKLLFYADFLAFIRLGSSISGQQYQKREFGPVPQDVKRVRAEMKTAEDLAIQVVPHLGKLQHRPIALREPNLEVFSPREVDLIREVVNWRRHMNATRISHESHKFRGWELAVEGEIIPYETMLVGKRRKPNEHEKRMIPKMAELARSCSAQK